MRRTEHDGPVDLAGMQSLAQRTFPLTGCRSAGELAWNCALSYDRPSCTTTALWRDNGQVVAWGWLELPGELMLQADAGYPGLADDVIAWAERAAAGPLEVAIADTETIAAAALRRRGYQPADSPFFSCLTRPLSSGPALEPGAPGEPPGAGLPPGYRIRPVRGDADAAQWVEVHRLAFPGSRFDLARRRHLTRIPPYRRDCDLAVAAPDGTLAAYCLGWYDEPTRTGEFEPVGTHPGHRRRGLAAAVCTAVLHRFAAAGAEQAIVAARGDPAYPAPKRLYESLGFAEHTRTRTFRQPG